MIALQVRWLGCTDWVFLGGLWEAPAIRKDFNPCDLQLLYLRGLPCPLFPGWFTNMFQPQKSGPQISISSHLRKNIWPTSGFHPSVSWTNKLVASFQLLRLANCAMSCWLQPITLPSSPKLEVEKKRTSDPTWWILLAVRWPSKICKTTTSRSLYITLSLKQHVLHPWDELVSQRIWRVDCLKFGRNFSKYSS